MVAGSGVAAAVTTTPDTGVPASASITRPRINPVPAGLSGLACLLLTPDVASTRSVNDAAILPSLATIEEILSIPVMGCVYTYCNYAYTRSAS